MTSDVRQPKAAAVIFVGQAFVIHAQQMQNRGMQVVEVDSILHGLVPDFIGVPVTDSAFDATTGQPRAEVVRVMVAARFAAGLCDR